jgi:hypothetical protein
MSSLRQLDDIHFKTAENNISAKLFGGRHAKGLYIAKTDSFGFGKPTKNANAKIHHKSQQQVGGVKCRPAVGRSTTRVIQVLAHALYKRPTLTKMPNFSSAADGRPHVVGRYGLFLIFTFFDTKYTP